MTNKLKRIGRDIAEIVAMVPLGAGAAVVGSHIIPHVYAESQQDDPRSPLQKKAEIIFKDALKIACKRIIIIDQIKMAALYTGGLAGIVGECAAYYTLARETHPAVLAIPVATNLASWMYESYKSRRGTNRK
ncbi:MAG: hypothetical protein IIC74_06805 [Bacteroidetes bacterium]|nr:hypothetical protein [Bacteroidota bacterium]